MNVKSEDFQKYFLALCAILLAKALVVIWVILKAGIGLGPDEAQYWTWSQHLALGYYSKPPGIAWQIRLGTLLFGNTELGVRFGAVVLGALLPLAVYWLAKSCKLKPETAFWAALVFAFSPLGFMSSFLAITDVGMVLFWTLGLGVVVRALSFEKPPAYFLIGFLIFAGALFKWPIYTLWVFIAGLLIVRNDLYRRRFWGGVIISLLGLAPSAIWNWTHDWATFKHVGATIEGKHEAAQATAGWLHGNFGEFLGSQAALLSPIFFLLLLAAFWSLARQRRRAQPSLLFVGAMAFLIIAFYAFLSFFKKMQGNWCDFAYPGAVVLLAWYACEMISWGKKWLKAGLLLSVAMAAFALLIPLLESESILAQYPIPYKMNLFKHNVGWNHLSQALVEAGYDPGQDFLFGDRYQASSILSFYGPEQKRAYFLNLQGIRKNQFSYWPGMAEERKGQTGFFIAAENSPQLDMRRESLPAEYHKMLESYFENVVFVGVYPLFYSYGKEVKGAFIFKCSGYNGRLPSEKGLY